MLSFSTDTLRPQDRFDHWCEVRGKSLFGVTIELERERRSSFNGRFSAVAIGGAVLAEMTASSYRVSRTVADIARVSSDSISIGWQMRGPGTMQTGRDVVHAVREGDVTISHSNLPFIGTPQRSDGFHFRALKIPLDGDIVLHARTHDLAPTAHARNTRAGRLISAMLDALTRQPAQSDDPAAAVQHIARLAMIARGRLAPGAPESRAALRAGLLDAARAILRRDLHRAGLSPGGVAAELAISLRQVHVLFEPTGLSFTRTLSMMRLAEARRQLEAMPERSIVQVAFACGFDSLATFYRVFRGAYAMTPGDVRAAAMHSESCPVL
jgi:AraC-like DNA-binding protein